MKLFPSDFDNLLCLPDDTEDHSLPGIALEARLSIPIKGFAILESKTRCYDSLTEVWASVSLTHGLAAVGDSKENAIDRLQELVTLYVQNSVKIDTWSGQFFLPKVKSYWRLWWRLRIVYWLVRWKVWPNAGCAFDTRIDVKLEGPWRDC